MKYEMSFVYVVGLVASTPDYYDVLDWHSKPKYANEYYYNQHRSEHISAVKLGDLEQVLKKRHPSATMVKKYDREIMSWIFTFTYEEE